MIILMIFFEIMRMQHNYKFYYCMYSIIYGNSNAIYNYIGYRVIKRSVV